MMIASQTTKIRIDPEAWFPLRHHDKQARLWRTRARFVGVVAGRGSGKTELARRRVVRMLSVRKPWPDPMYFYALPTYDQAKRVAWRPLLRLIPEPWVKSVNKSELMVETVFGSLLYLLGMDKPARIEGNQWDFGIVDESCDQRPEAFSLSVLPALSHRDGGCWRIGVPKRSGVGAAEFRRWCQEKAEEYYSWPSEDILTPEQLQYARDTLDERDYGEQYRAKWESVGGSVFYAFDEELDVSAQVAYDPAVAIIVGSDFNVDPMCWTLCQVGGPREARVLRVFDELKLRDTNTQRTLDRLWDTYGARHQGSWWFLGDASGRARKTSASLSDYLIIKSDARFRDKKVRYADSNPARADRFAATNAVFCNAAKRRRCLVHPRCEGLIKDLKERGYKPGTSDPADHGDVGHMTDAFGYVVWTLFPIRVPGAEATQEVGLWD